MRYAALPLVLLPLLVACSSPGRNAATAAGRPGGRGANGAVPVVTARVQQKPMPVTLPAVGTVEAISSVQIRSQVTGQLSAIHFEEGREVRKGEPLFSLDSRPFKATVAQAEAVLARDTATLHNSEAQQARSDSLFQRGLIARDAHESQLASTQALRATVEADRAALETARLNLQFTSIAAPITGRTGALGVHVGDLVRANDTTPLVVINQLAPAYVAFSVPGRYLPEIRRYQARKPLAVSATIPSASAPAARGVVDFIDNSVDSATGTIRLKALFANAGHELWPGAFVQVTLELTTNPTALVVPATAVQASQDGRFIYVVKADQTVDMRPVTVDRQQGAETVIAEGVKAGDEVVTDGQLRLTPGARVSQRGARGRE